MTIISWCKWCQTNVYVDVIQDWDNLHMIHTYIYKCQSCGRIITRETVRPEETG